MTNQAAQAREEEGEDERHVVENKDRYYPLVPYFIDEWDKALHARKLVKPSRYNRHAADPEGVDRAHFLAYKGMAAAAAPTRRT